MYLWIIFPDNLTTVCIFPHFSSIDFCRNIHRASHSLLRPVMLNRLFDNPTQVALEYALDATSARGHLIANNIANADTPGYKALRLSFEDILASELNRTEQGSIGLRQTDPRHLPGTVFHGLKGIPTPSGFVYSDDRTTYRLDNNNVDIDHEMAEQARNAIEYSALTELVSRRLSGLRTAISEGRR